MLTTGDLNGEDEDDDTPIYAKKDSQLYGKQSNRKDRFVSMQFMKKYIHLAKAIRVSHLRTCFFVNMRFLLHVIFLVDKHFKT